MLSYSDGILPKVKFSFQKLKTNTCIDILYNVKTTFLILYIFVCSAALYIPGDDFIFEKDTPLIITCIHAKNKSNINFKFDNTLLGTCYSLFGCNTLDNTFTISAVTSIYPREYFLRSVHNFDTTLCGTYQCTDIDTNIQDSVKVSYKEFNNNSFLVEETDDAFYISTACVFPASYTDLELSWFIFDNSSLRGLNLTSDNDFITVVKATSECPDVTCNNMSAKHFHFGLKFNNHSESFSSVFIEIKLVHTHFPNKQLVWRSSKVYPMEDNVFNTKHSSPTQNADFDVKSIIGIVFGVAGTILLVILSVALVKWRKSRNKRSKSNDGETGSDEKVVLTGERPKNCKTESEQTEDNIAVGMVKNDETGRGKSTSNADRSRSTSKDGESCSIKLNDEETDSDKSSLDESETVSENSTHNDDENDNAKPTSKYRETGSDKPTSKDVQTGRDMYSLREGDSGSNKNTSKADGKVQDDKSVKMYTFSDKPMSNDDETDNAKLTSKAGESDREKPTSKDDEKRGEKSKLYDDKTDNGKPTSRNGETYSVNCTLKDGATGSDKPTSEDSDTRSDKSKSKDDETDIEKYRSKDDETDNAKPTSKDGETASDKPTSEDVKTGIDTSTSREVETVSYTSMSKERDTGCDKSTTKDDGTRIDRSRVTQSVTKPHQRRVKQPATRK